MEEIPLSSEKTSSEPGETQKKIFKNITLPQAVVFGIIAISIGLLLLFGILNYSNILSISDILPKYHGSLPQKEVPSGTSQTKNPSKNNPVNYTPVLSSAPQTFQYDIIRAEDLLAQYVKNEIKPELLPAKFNIKQGLTYDGQASNVGYQFGSNIVVNNATISASFHLKENTNLENAYNIFVQLETPDAPTATASLANSLLSSYFTKPLPAEKCQTKGTKSYCENFQSLDDGNRGYGILFGYDSANPSKSIVFTCFILKDSAYYNDLKSCISP